MAATDRTPADRNLDAEVRAVEAGHRALLHDAEGPAWRHTWHVVSDTHHGKRYLVALNLRPWDAGEALSWLCQPIGTKAYADDHLARPSATMGVVPCMHVAVVARRLEREGLAELSPEGLWVATDKLADRPPPLTEAEAAAIFDQL